MNKLILFKYTYMAEAEEEPRIKTWAQKNIIFISKK